jgi:glycosyltransferase involved in cell wall biosynthesis
MRRWERILDNSPDVTAFTDVSGADVAVHVRRTAKPVVHVPVFALSGGVPPHSADPAPDRSGVLFVGSLDVETNIAALRWLMDDVWDLVRERHPSTTLTVVGRRPSDALRRRLLDAQDSGVVLHADVPDVDTYFRNAAVAVNPVRTGAGISVKLLQSVAAGCASVSTTAGATGFDWVAGEHLVVADSAKAFADAVSSLLADRSYRETIGGAGQAFVRAELEPQANLAKVARLFGVR